MPVWKTTPITERPSLKLRSWAVFEVAASGKSLESTRHFVGYNVTEHEGRVSSAIVAFDVATRRGKTRKGRVYELVGPPGLDSDANYVWNMWLAINEVTEVVDITDDFLPPDVNDATR